MQTPKINTEDVSTKQIETYVRLAGEPVDILLLGRYFRLSSGQDLDDELTPREKRWVVANLSGNQSWRDAWQDLESSVGRAVDWHPRDPQSLARAPLKRFARVRWPIAAALATATLYGSLWLGGRAALPDTYRLASLNGYQGLLEQQTRSAGTKAQDSFAEAAKAMLSAPRTTLGLFPRYDDASVRKAIEHLEAAFRASDDQFERAEMAFFLAKAHLMSEEAAAAERWLRQVLAQDVADYREDSNILLEALETTSADQSISQ